MGAEARNFSADLEFEQNCQNCNSGQKRQNRHFWHFRHFARPAKIEVGLRAAPFRTRTYSAKRPCSVHFLILPLPHKRGFWAQISGFENFWPGIFRIFQKLENRHFYLQIPTQTFRAAQKFRQADDFIWRFPQSDDRRKSGIFRKVQNGHFRRFWKRAWVDIL